MNAETGLDRPHVFLPADDAAAGPLLLLLHGTGGNEYDLLPLRDRLSPGAAVLSVRGTVLENGMPRFFRRVSEGVFDEEDLHRRAEELAEFVGTAGAAYGIEDRSLVAVGFSNGANIASAPCRRDECAAHDDRPPRPAPTSPRRCCCSGRDCWPAPCCWPPWCRTPSRPMLISPVRW